MKGVTLTILFLILSFSLAIAEKEKSKSETEKPKTENEKPKSESEKPKSESEKPKVEPINVDEVCKNTTSKPACEATLKSLGVNEDNQKPSKFAQKLIRHAQSEFGHTATIAREKMREDDLDMKIKKSLSHCVKMYLDIADQLRGLYLAAKSKKFSSEGMDFIHMARNFPRHCEHGLKKVETSGEKLHLYKDYKDLEDLASTVDSVYSYVYAKKAEDGKQ